MQSRFAFSYCPRTGQFDTLEQIIEPHDKGISESIKSSLTPATWEVGGVETSPFSSNVTQEMHDAYFVSLSTLLVSRYAFFNTSIVMYDNSCATDNSTREHPLNL